MSIKENAIELIRSLPDEATYDEIMHELYVQQKIDKGMQEFEEGKGIPHDEVLRKFNR